MIAPAPTVAVDCSVLRGRIAAIYARNPQTVDALVQLAERADYRLLMQQVESTLAETKDDEPVADLDARIAEPTARQFYRDVADNTSLLHALRQPPLLSQYPPRVIEALARFADVRPSRDGMLATRDGMFRRVLGLVERGLPVSESRLLLEDFERMSALQERAPDAMAWIEDIARDGQWPADIELIETELERPGEPLSGMPSTPAGTSLRAWARVEPATGQTQDETRPRLLLASPRFSTMHRDAVTSFAGAKTQLPAPEELLSKEIYKSGLSASERSGSQAQRVMKLVPQPTRDLIALCVNVRIDAAKEYMKLRASAKVDGLTFSWPELAAYLRFDRAELLNLEAWVLQPDVTRDQALGRLGAYSRDERLVRFLRLRPWLKDLYPSEVQSLLPPTAPAKPAVEAVPNAAASAAPVYADLLLQLTKQPNGYTVMLNGAGGAVSGTTSPLDEVAFAFSGRASNLREQQSALREAHDEELMARLRTVGEQVFDWAFPDMVGGRLLETLRSKARVRLRIKWDDPGLARVPWETIYVPAIHGFLALHESSVVRQMDAARPASVVRFDTPLRVLAVLSNPVDTAPLNVEGEAEMLRAVLSQGEANGLVRLSVLSPAEATRFNLLQALRSFRPHIFHFVGHGLYEQNQGSLVLGEEDNRWRALRAEEVGTMLAGSGVLLAVLNACETGASQTNDAVTSVAGTLVVQGVPASVATMHAVEDRAALMFTRTFYASLVEGDPLETALTQARKALGLERWDWSVYALFANTPDLDRFAVDARRQTRSSL